VRTLKLVGAVLIFLFLLAFFGTLAFDFVGWGRVVAVALVFLSFWWFMAVLRKEL
jgi:hypothetical protein